MCFIFTLNDQNLIFLQKEKKGKEEKEEKEKKECGCELSLNIYFAFQATLQDLSFV